MSHHPLLFASWTGDGVAVARRKGGLRGTEWCRARRFVGSGGGHGGGGGVTRRWRSGVDYVVGIA